MLLHGRPYDLPGVPEVWVADEDTYSRRRQTAERAGVLAQLVRIKGCMKAMFMLRHRR